MNRKGMLAAFLGALLFGLAGASGGDQGTEPVLLKAQIEQLRRERDTLEARVLLLQEKLEEARSTATNAKSQIETLDRRCKQLQEELTQIRAEREMQRLPAEHPRSEAPFMVLPAPAPKTAAKPAVARGKITAVGADGVLMQISIGSDSGIKEGQVLEVFRLNVPSGKERVLPIYLGTLKLTRVDLRVSLGQFKGISGLDRRAKVGDEVASELFVK